MITLAIAALIGAQTIVVPTTPVAPSQALPATASSPQIKVPDPSTTPSSGGLVAQPKAATPVPSTPMIVPQASAAGTVSSEAASRSLNTRDRTALPTATMPSGLPAGMTGGPTFGGTSSIQTDGH